MDIYEMKSYTTEDLSRLVHVQADITAKWDGKDYDLRNGADVKFGLYLTWRDTYKKVTFTLSEVSETPKDKREIQNPLEENDRGASFEGLSRRKPRGQVN